MTDLCFFFNVVEYEAKLAKRLVNQLNYFYPHADKIAIRDGNFNLQLENVNLETGNTTLKRPGTIGKFIERNWTTVLANSKAKIFIQVDPDSYLWKSFKEIPDSDWFGDTTIQYINSKLNTIFVVMGYAVGFKRELLEQGLSSGLLNYPKIENNRIYRKCIPSEDVAVGWVLSNLGAIPEKWKEVDEIRTAGVYKQLKPYKFALTHPVKTCTVYN